MDPSNYRGISFLNVIYKIVSSILNDRLTKFANDFNILVDCQAGFRSDYLAVDRVFCLQSMIQKYLSRPKGSFCLLHVDFKTAFYTLNHTSIFTCLNKYRTTGKY